jgi:tetratricopeptide (TPR) repeat protein
VSETEHQLREKLAAAEAMPYGRAQIAAVEHVQRHVDAQNIAELQFQTRMLATSAYTYGGEPAKAFVTFSWCLAARDRGEGDGYDHELHWQFKWMVNAMTRFPEIPLERTYAVLDDMERRYRLAGHTLNPVHQHRELVARHVGDADTAAEQYRLWCAAPRGEMSDCSGCEPTSKVNHLSWLRRDEEAVAVAMPVLDGQLNCFEQPHTILTSLLFPYLRTGRHAEAADAHRRAYRAIQANRAELSTLATHLEFCARTGNHARGLDLVERHLGWLAEPPTPWADLQFSSSAALVLRQVAEAGHGDAPVRRSDGQAQTSVSVLREELADRAIALARRFDERNGTTAVGDRFAAKLAAEPLTEHLPLSGHARRAVAQPKPEPEPAVLPDSPAELVELAKKHGRAGDHDMVALVWRKFDEVCPDPEPALLAHRLYDQAVELIDDDPAEAERLLVRVAELFEQVGEHERRVAARAYVGLAWCREGRVEEGLAEVVARTEEMTAVGDEKAQAVQRLRLGFVYQSVDRVDEALAAFGAAADLADRAGATEVVGDAALCLTRVYVGMGEGWHRIALVHADRAVAAYATLEPRDNLREAQFHAGRLHAAAGELEAAYDLLGEAVKVRDPNARVVALHMKGKVALDLGRAGDARDALAEALAEFGPDQHHAAYLKVDFAAASLAVERPDDAADALEEAVAGLTSPEDGDELDRARFLLARAYRALDQDDQALELLDQVTERCVAGGNQAGAGQMLALAGDILDELNRDEQAAEHYTRAAEAYLAAEMPLYALANRRKAAMSWRWAYDGDRAMAALAAADEAAAAVPDGEPQVLWEKAMLAYDGARIIADAGRIADAVPRTAEAVAGLRSLDAAVEAAIATVFHGRLLAELDRAPEAEELLVAALRDLPPDESGHREEVEELLTAIRERTP